MPTPSGEEPRWKLLGHASEEAYKKHLAAVDLYFKILSDKTTTTREKITEMTLLLDSMDKKPVPSPRYFEAVND